MTCHVLKDPAGGVIIACGRNAPAQRCATCSKLGQLLCDGCDKPLCAPCSVSPSSALDFCPTCARSLFVEWHKSAEGKRWESGAAALKLAPDALRDLRRNAFRKWAKENPERFDGVRSAQSVKVHPRPVPVLPAQSSQAETSSPEIQRSVQMVRALSSSLRVETELNVARKNLAFVVIDNVKIPEGTPIHTQWLLEQK